MERGMAVERTERRTSMPVFKNTAILKRPGLAAGISFGFVAPVAGFASGKSVYALSRTGFCGDMGGR